VNIKNNIRRRNAILGALVADAASLGLHWLYDQQRIHDVAPVSPEFRTPTLADYEGFPGYFAHGRKSSGELSHYGEQAMTLLRSLVANGGRYDKTEYENLFCERFGYGGNYVGYIDHPTRATLDNSARAEHEALKRAEAIPVEANDGTKYRMITKVLSNIKQASGAKLRDKVEQAVRQTHDDDKMVSYAHQILSELECISGFHGADDEQLPAISKLPALVAAYVGDDALSTITESAVRVTINNDRAVAFGHVTSCMIETAIQENDVKAAIIAGRTVANSEIKKLIEQALDFKTTSIPEVTSKFGLSCNLVFGVPSVIHNLARMDSYTQAIRQNIIADGDSCGRAILLGAVLGSIHGIGGVNGIPEAWIGKLKQKGEVAQLLQKLLP